MDDIGPKHFKIADRIQHKLIDKTVGLAGIGGCRRSVGIHVAVNDGDIYTFQRIIKVSFIFNVSFIDYL